MCVLKWTGCKCWDWFTFKGQEYFYSKTEKCDFSDNTVNYWCFSISYDDDTYESLKH